MANSPRPPELSRREGPGTAWRIHVRDLVLASSALLLVSLDYFDVTLLK